MGQESQAEGIAWPGDLEGFHLRAAESPVHVSRMQKA